MAAARLYNGPAVRWLSMILHWLVFALATIYHASPFPFNMGWWGFTFPLGVYAANTLLLGQQLDLMFFRIFGMVSIYQHLENYEY